MAQWPLFEMDIAEADTVAASYLNATSASGWIQEDIKIHDIAFSNH